MRPMRIRFYKKILLLWMLYREYKKLPHDYKKEFLLNPISITRYEEFIFLLSFLKENKMNGLDILDISSPHMLAYLLSNENNVLKINIDENEGRYIKQTSRLIFKKENALKLSFDNNKYDLCYSISVLEHIYRQYDKALEEMIRVTKPGGCVYFTLPVSQAHLEEWGEQDIYSDQYKQDGRTFFQYRFNKDDISCLMKKLKHVTVEKNEIYWERFNGAYDLTISALKKNFISKRLSILKNYFINTFIGLFLMRSVPGNFEEPYSFGNIHVILKKK